MILELHKYEDTIDVSYLIVPRGDNGSVFNLRQSISDMLEIDFSYETYKINNSFVETIQLKNEQKKVCTCTFRKVTKSK